MGGVESICADLGIAISECHELSGPMRTKTVQTLRLVHVDNGEGHVIITLTRTKMEFQSFEEPTGRPSH